MPRILPRSLKGLLRLNESAFLLLVIATATSTGLWAHFWTRSAEEAVRINTLVREAERIRGDMYRQVHEATSARLTENPRALSVYAEYQSRITAHFVQMTGLAGDEDEHAAIDYLRETYRAVHEDMDKVYTDPNDISLDARMKLLDPAHAVWMLGEFESAMRVFDGIIELRQQRLEAVRSGWTQRWTPVVVPVAIAIAVGLVWFSRSSLQRGVLAPLARLIEDTVVVSRGDLGHRTEPGGVEEVRMLGATFDQMTRALETSQRTVIESERQAALGALVPVVAHNIRNPLASIRATAQVMDRDSDADEIAEGRGAIIDTVDRLERWVSALLSYLHPLEPRRREVRIDEVVGGALAALDIKVADRGLSVAHHPAEGGTTVEADHDLLEQAVYSLLGNAVEASPAGGVLTIRYDAHDDRVAIDIDDEGPGIGFDPQPRGLSPGPTTKSGGFGLGIPIAYKICQAHGGEVSIQPRAEGGTRARLVLPRRADEAP